MTDPGLISEQCTNPRKRPKLEPDSDTDDIDADVDEKPFVNHPTLYFDDGNVILTTGRTLFCVHRSLLSKHSPVFRELFEQDHDRFRGLIQLPMEETPEDLEALLGVIYDGLRLDVQQLTVETFPALATLLRMSKRYQIEKPCQDIVARIRAEWPATLAQHDAKEAKLKAERTQGLGQQAGDVKPQPNILDDFMDQQPRPFNSIPPPVQGMGGMRAVGNPNMPQAAPYRDLGLRMDGGLYPPHVNRVVYMGGVGVGGGGVGAFHAVGHVPNAIAGPSNAPAPAPPRHPAAPPPSALRAADSKEDLIVHPASVIGLLRECGYADTQLLFPLFYALSRTTWQFGGPALGHHLAPLSAADMERFVVGIERMREHYTAFAVAVPTLDPSPHQAGPGGAPFMSVPCSEGIKQLWQACASTLLLPSAGRGLAREPLEALAALAPAVSAQGGQCRVCTACGRALTAEIEAFRRELWAKLPQFFELA